MKDVKILLIDDDEDYVEATILMLKSKNYTVVSALDFEDGLFKAKTVSPDLILLDAMLMHNDRSGLEFPNEIRKDPATAHIQILMISSINENNTGFKFSPGSKDKRLPIDDFLNKPAQPGELHEKIDNLLKMGASKWANQPPI